MKAPTLLSLWLLCFSACGLTQNDLQKKDDNGLKPIIRGWNILTNIPEEGEAIIQRAKEYEVNHLQLSHHLIMDLKDARDKRKVALVNSFIDKAHQENIKEVLVWDHALYNLDYYPDEFKNSAGKLDLDNAGFWEWFKNDYREMMALLPKVDGIVLTFIETGARAEDQYSEYLKTGGEKLALVVNAIADVLIKELDKSLYIRTFAYNDTEYKNVLECVQLLEHDEIKLMIKETPHDFFLYHPPNPLPGKIDRPTLVEFDLGNEFNGQSIIANTYVEHVFNRWKSFEDRPHVIGYVARVDRYGTTKTIDKPSEILLEAMYRAPTLEKYDSIYNIFLKKRYGEAAFADLNKAFRLSYGIVKSSFYTLGLNSNNHSGLDFDYRSIYTRHVSGRWTDSPMVKVENGVNKEFHYWKHIVNHLAPAHHKKAEGYNLKEIPKVLEVNWIQPKELMNQKYLEYVITEKDYGVDLAMQALGHIKAVENKVETKSYQVLYDTFYRTLIAAKLRRAVAKAYYGYRIYARGEEHRTEKLHAIIEEGLAETRQMIAEIKTMKEVPSGQWKWHRDAEVAEAYIEKITKKGWEQYGNVVFQ
ncbi:hypothetical protein [Maribacter sp. 2307ULW6-5]|uniref:hypothetical protein n=1 Tax=Maribacter sp. 2307ULW6-5 TaxID=3386275 RepID=UPI0039BD20CD